MITISSYKSQNKCVTVNNTIVCVGIALFNTLRCTLLHVAT